MVDPTTTNTSMSVPIRGSDVGTWDTPVNGNFNSLDAMLGGVTTLALTSAAVTLTTSQALVNVIRFTGTLNSNVAVTLPGIYKSWTIDNQITNSPSSFRVTLVSTSAASIIGCPPAAQDIFYDGTTIKYRNLGRVGEYWDYAASTVPSWVTASTKPPYLNCNAATFSSATYPILANLLGTTTLPDLKGVSRATLNQGSSRITSSGSGLNGDTLFARGGAETVTLNSSQLPAHAHSVTDTHRHSLGQGAYANLFAGATPTTAQGFNAAGTPPLTQVSSVGSITVNNSTGSNLPVSVMPPTTISGITMIRAE